MIEKSLSFTSRPQVIMNEYDIESGLQSMRSDIELRIDRFTMKGSGWADIGLLNHDLHVNSYDPLAARSYIPLPSEIQNKKATINIKNDDNKCFIYCLGRALDVSPEGTRLDRVSKHLKNVCEDLGLNNIKTPVNIQDLPKIETQFNISINLYCDDMPGPHLLLLLLYPPDPLRLTSTYTRKWPGASGAQRLCVGGGDTTTPSPLTPDCTGKALAVC